MEGVISVDGAIARDKTDVNDSTKRCCIVLLERVNVVIEVEWAISFVIKGDNSCVTSYAVLYSKLLRKNVGRDCEVFQKHR